MCKSVYLRYAGDRQCRVLGVRQRLQRGNVDPVVSCEQDWCLNYRVSWGYGARSESLDHQVVAGSAVKRVWNLGDEVVACLAGQERTRGWGGDCLSDDEG